MLEAPFDAAADEAARLRRCLNDLVSVLALPAAWTGSVPSQIVGTLLDALVGMLSLDFAYARLREPDGQSSIEMIRVAEAMDDAAPPRAIGEALERSLGEASPQWPASARISIAGDLVSIARARLGLQGEIGVVICGTRRTHFPDQTESLLLDVAANQAVIGLQQERLLTEQKRVAEELDERVALRTRELAAANDELRREVSERQRAEEALVDSERDSRLIVDSIPGLVALLTAAGAVEIVNRQVLDYSGRTLEDLKKWGTSDIVHPEDLPQVVEIFSRAIVAGTPYDIVQRLRRSDGVYRWFQNSGYPLRTSHGQIARWCVLLTDIDDLKRAEEELRRKETFLAHGQRLSLTGSFSWYVDTDVVTFSAELSRIFEFDRDRPVTLERIAARIHPEDLHVMSETVETSRRGGGDLDYEIRLRMPDGSVKYVHTFSRDTRDPHGRREYIGAVQDVTQRRLATEALNKARSDLAHVSRVTAFSALTASIAHEVNQPLSGIITNASTCLRMLDAEPPNVDGARETARRTIRDGNRAADVIARLRALFSKRDFTAEPLDLNEATREVIALSLGDLQRNHVMLRAELADDLPLVVGDRVQLQQVVLNLLRNGSDAMAAVHDRPRLLIVRTEREDGNRVRLTVQDAGAGLDPDAVDKLFQAFYTTKNGGMGIGLSVSRSIIDRHQGRLWAASNDGPGATFAFSIPLDPALK